MNKYRRSLALLDQDDIVRINPKPDRQRLRWFVSAICYLCLVIYGSLVPLNYQPLPWDLAIIDFRNLPFLNLDLHHRADWVANILLFVPLAFLTCGTLIRTVHSRLRQILTALVVILVSFGIACGIEFTQQWFPPRTTSQNDIVAELLGAIAGCLLWFLSGPKIQYWLREESWKKDRRLALERIILVYLLGLLVYSVMPLDLTISAAEIELKSMQGKIEIMPYLEWPDTIEAWIVFISRVLIFVPIGVYFSLFARRVKPASSKFTSFLWVALIALSIELLQLFVYSRYSSGCHFLLATFGGTLGLIGTEVCLSGTSGNPLGEPRSSHSGGWSSVFGLMVLWLVYAAGLCFLFWWPLEPIGDSIEIEFRLLEFWQIPFRNYYYGTEFQALTQILQKMLLFAPLGILIRLAVNRSGFPSSFRRVATCCWVLLMGAVAVGIELGQAYFPARYPDVTDSLICFAGGLIGYLIVSHFGVSEQQGLRRSVRNDDAADYV